MVLLKFTLLVSVVSKYFIFHCVHTQKGVTSWNYATLRTGIGACIASLKTFFLQFALFASIWRNKWFFWLFCYLLLKPTASNKLCFLEVLSPTECPTTRRLLWIFSVLITLKTPFEWVLVGTLITTLNQFIIWVLAQKDTLKITRKWTLVYPYFFSEIEYLPL